MLDGETYITDQKIKLFVSSGMAARSLQSIRARIHDLLNNSPYVTGWLFEHAGASTLPAEYDYRLQVADANVCAFIIDGRYEIPEGVQKELDEASRRNKKCFYYFYKVSHEGPRRLREDLKGPDKSHYCEVERLGDIPSMLLRDVVDEIFFLYRAYTASDINLPMGEGALSLSPIPDDTFVNRSALVGFTACGTLMSNFLYGYDSTPESDDDLDMAAASFFEAVYIRAAPHELRVSTLLSALEQRLPKRYYPTIALRWHAVQQYYLGDLPESLALEKQALDTARDSELPAWFIDDILIDLRNLEAETDRAQGIIWRPDSYQEEIDRRNREIQLPLVDRMTAKLLESMLAEELKGRVQSAYTITLGGPSNKWVGELVQLFVSMIHYGSLTHLRLLARRMRLVASYIWRATGNRAALISEFKLALITDSEKNVQGFLATNGQLLGRLTCEEADHAFRFAWSAASGYERDEARMTALATLGPFLSDAMFYRAMEDARICCKGLLANAPTPPSSLHSMLVQCGPRDRSPWIIDLTIAALDKGPNTRWASEALLFIANGTIGMQGLDDKQADALLAALGRQATSENPDKDFLIMAISGIASLTVRQTDWYAQFEELLSDDQRRTLVMELDGIDDSQANGLLEESLKEIRSDNATQGVGGMWSDGINHYGRVEVLLAGHDCSKDDLPNLLAIACAETLIAPRQTTDAKWNASLTLLFLLGYDKRLLHDETLLTRLRELDVSEFTSAQLSPFDSYNESNARIACIAVREAYGIDEAGSLRLALLEKYWGEPGELGRLTKLLGHIVSERLWGLIDDDAILCSLEFLLSLTAHESNEVRRAAISAILPMTKHPTYARPTCAALARTFPSSHPGSKHTILNAVRDGGAFTTEERYRIVQSAANSSCYDVRERIANDELKR